MLNQVYDVTCHHDVGWILMFKLQMDENYIFWLKTFTVFSVELCFFLKVGRCALDMYRKRKTLLSKSNLKKLPIKKFKKGKFGFVLCPSNLSLIVRICIATASLSIFGNHAH